MSLKLESNAFVNGAIIPEQYTCDGENISPPLQWTGVPDHTKSFAIVIDDPDAPSKTWVHWVLYNIAGEKRMLGKHIPGTAILKTGAMNGVNDFNKYGYAGPCPPTGMHHYYFRIYALNELLKVKPGLNKSQLTDAMEGHIIDMATLIGVYKRN